MTEHEDREAHEAKADELERELDDMQERSERLGGDIEGAGEDWEQQKKDESVPGATADLDDEADGDDGEVDAEELDFGRDIGTEAVVAEDGPPSDEDDDDSEDDSDEDDSDEDDSDDDED
jgi:ribonuclease E